MMLRPRQRVFVDKCQAALVEKGNTLGIAPTGAGKTVMLAAVAGGTPGTGLILQHRDELVAQNARTFHKMHPKVDLSIYGADRKRWARGGMTFGMIQTVVNALEGMPRLDFLGIDEAHHSTSNSYLKVIHAAKAANPDLRLYGTTATPQRGDRRGLNAVFSNVADVIQIRELIEAGHLVRPRTFVVDVGVRGQLEGVRRLTTDFDMEEVARIMDQRVVNDAVVQHWKEKAGDRQTVMFCANIEHARHVTEALQAAGVAAGMVDGKMDGAARARLLSAFDRRELQVVVNVMVLTEGWDCQPVSCVVLLKPSSFKSTMIQMIGRGLRKLDPELHPGIVKSDCVVIDFGTSVLTYGSIEADGALRDDEVKDCPECNAHLPGSCPECPLCGYTFPKDPTPPAVKTCQGCGHENAIQRRTCAGCGIMLVEPVEKDALSEFILTEVELFARSPYEWEPLWEGSVYVANSQTAWGGVVNYRGAWYAVGGGSGLGIHLLAAGQERLVALASGDDWMRENGDAGASGKDKKWLSMPPTDKQLEALKMDRMQAIGLTRYKASCLMTWKWSDRHIRAKIEAAHAAQHERPAA